MNYPLLYQWEQLLSAHLPSLNSWQQANIALFSYGVMLSESSQQGAIARAVCGAEAVESTTRRLRRFVSNEAVELERFFQEWSGWVISAVGTQRVTLVVDETKLGAKLGVMVVGLAWEGRCIPLAWRVYRANSSADYPAEGQVRMIADLLALVKAGLGSAVSVLVLADRGIGTSPDLCRVVEGLGWHYLFRVTGQSKIITEQGEYSIAQQGKVGEVWAASGLVFKKRGRIAAHARAIWSTGYEQPWALVTNAAALSGAEYARRNWQEQSFRDLKSGGWHWGESRIRHPEHMLRLLVLLTLAYAWMVALGSQAVAADCAQPLVKQADGTLRRLWSLFKEGLRYFVQFVQRHTVCLDLLFIPDKRFT